MTEHGAKPRMTIVASPNELPGRSRIWGTGGWQPPREREARDWLVLARVLGWKASIETDLEHALRSAAPIVVIARDHSWSSDDLDLLADTLSNTAVTVISRAASQTPIAGRTLQWRGRGPRGVWSSATPLNASQLEMASDSQVWAALDGNPLITARAVRRGTIVTLGFHPSEFCDAAPVASQLLKRLLIWGPPGPAAWFDLSGTLVLRMDDPGGSQNVFSRNWCYPKLSEDAWGNMTEILRRHEARISLGYVPAWVDDGDAERGRLQVAGRVVPRRAGEIWPSHQVQYRDLCGHQPGALYDYQSEYRGIRRLCRAGCGDVELHGFTHLHPDRLAWAGADDRYENVHWFRELGQAAAEAINRLPADGHPLARGVEALQTTFGVRPTTLICPGDEWTNGVLETALDLGFALISSYHLAVRCEERFCWAQQIQAPYLNEPAPRWFESIFPVVGYFHDFEPATQGVSWFRDHFERWLAAGARRVMDFRELSAHLAHSIALEIDNQPRLCITSEIPIAAPRPMRVFMHFGGLAAPLSLEAILEGRTVRLPSAAFLDGASYVELTQLGNIGRRF
jgi:hypothetical protein